MVWFILMPPVTAKVRLALVGSEEHSELPLQWAGREVVTAGGLRLFHSPRGALGWGLDSRSLGKGGPWSHGPWLQGAHLDKKSWLKEKASKTRLAAGKRQMWQSSRIFHLDTRSSHKELSPPCSIIGDGNVLASGTFSRCLQDACVPTAHSPQKSRVIF